MLLWREIEAALHLLGHETLHEAEHLRRKLRIFDTW